MNALLALALLAATSATAADSRRLLELKIESCHAEAEAAEAIDETTYNSTLNACFKASGNEWAMNLFDGDGERYGGFTDSDLGCTDDCLDSQ